MASVTNRNAIIITLVLAVIMFIAYQLTARRPGPVKITFLGYTNASAGSHMGFFGATAPIEAPAGSRVALIGLTNAITEPVGRWSICRVEVRGSGTTNVWLDSATVLQPGQGECLKVPLPATNGHWRLILHTTHGAKDRWIQFLNKSRFVPNFLRVGPDHTYSDWTE
jgi:hypothetical protein